MKKNLVRILSGVMTLVLILSLLPMAALAAETGTTDVLAGLFGSRRATAESAIALDPSFSETITVGDKDVVVKASDYEQLISVDGVYYDLIGLHTMESLISGGRPAKSVTLGAYNAAQFAEWYNSFGTVLLAYGPHEHKAWNNQWFYSLTNHWQYCEICREVFNMNWHHDKDENDVCDECEQAIHYYDITVAETSGGKVEVSTDKARLNDRVDVTITPDSGYKVKSIAFYNNNEQHSQVCQYMDVPYSEYHFIVLPWDVDVVVEFEAE